MWFIAAISPLLIAPIWFAFPQAVLGPLHSFSGLLLVLLLVSSSISDLSQRRIFNWTTYIALVWALVINLVPSSIGSLSIDIGSMGMLNSLYGAVVCFAVMLIPYTFARGGAGDVKLATALGALTGVDSGLLIIAFAYIIAATAIIGWTLWNRGPLNLLSAMCKYVGVQWLPKYVQAPTEQQKQLLNQPIPLAGFFAIAALLVEFDVSAMLGSL